MTWEPSIKLQNSPSKEPEKQPSPLLQKESLKKSKENPPINPEAETLELMKEEEKENIKEYGIAERTGSKLGILEENDLYAPDTQTPQKIEAINPNEALNEADMSQMANVTVIILGKLFQNGFKAEDIKSLEELKVALQKVQKEEKYQELRNSLSSFSEKATLQKLLEILENPSANPESPYASLQKNWGEFLIKSKEIAKEAEKGTASKAWEWVTQNKGKVASALLLIGGAWALYNMLSSDSEKKGAKESGWMDRVFSKKNIMPLAIFTLGATLGSGQVVDWVKKELLGEVKDTALRAAGKAKEASLRLLNEKLGFDSAKFDSAKENILRVMPHAPEWLKNADLQKVAEDMGIDPEKTGSWEKYQGKGGAEKLLYDWMKQKHNVEPSSEQKEIAKEYGEFVPAKEAMGNYYKELEKTLKPLQAWAIENQEATAVAGLFLASFESVRAAVGGGVKGSFNGFVGLAKMPFKAVKNFPLTSLFAVSAALMAEDRFQVKDAAGNIMVPKDPENLKKYVTKKLENSNEWTQDLPPIPKAHIEKAVEIILEPKQLEEYVGPAEEMIGNLTVGALEMVALSPQEVITQTNDEGLHVLASAHLELLQLNEEKESEKYEQYQRLIEKVQEVRVRLAEGKPVTQETFTKELEEIAAPLGIHFFLHDGYMAWVKKEIESDIPRITYGPSNIMVDPELKEDEALEKARRFVSQDSISNAIGKGFEIPIQDLRLMLDETLFKDIHGIEDAEKIIDQKIRGGAYMVFYGGKAWLYEAGEGAVQRYALGPINIAKHLFKGLTGDFSAVEAAVDYSEGVLPVLIMGLTANIVRGNFTKVFSKKILFESIAYPVKGLWDITQIGFRHVLPNLKAENPLKAIFKDPKLKVQSDAMSIGNNWKNKMAVFSSNPIISRALAGEYEDLANLYEAEKYLHEANYKKWSRSRLNKEVGGAIGNIKGIDTKKLNTGNSSEFLKVLQKEIAERENLIKTLRKNLKQIDQYSLAARYLEKGKTEKAKEVLKKLSYSGEASKEAIERKTQEIKNQVKENHSDIEEIKDLSQKEQNDIVEKFKDSQPDIERLRDEGAQTIRKATEQATREGRSLSDPEVKQKLDSIRQEYDQKFADLFEKKGLGKIALVDDATLQKNGFDPKKVRQEIPKLEAKISKGRARLKQVGRGLFGFAAALLAMYGISKGIEWFHSEETGFDIEKLEAKESTEEKNTRKETTEKMKEDNEYHSEVMQEIQAYFSAVESDYTDLNEIIGSPEKLSQTSDKELIKKVNEASEKHEANIEKLKEFVVTNREAIRLYYEKLPKNKEGKDRSLGQFFSIGYNADKERPYLKYADESDLRDSFYEIIDFYRNHMEKLLKGEKISGWDQAAYAGSYAVPLYGTYRDGEDCYKALKRGEWLSAAGSGAWTVVGGASDVLMGLGIFTFGTTAVVGGALKGVRWGGAGIKGAAKGARMAKIVARVEQLQKAMEAVKTSSKVAKASKYAGTATMAGMGADLGRQMFNPPKSETYLF